MKRLRGRSVSITGSGNTLMIAISIRGAVATIRPAAIAALALTLTVVGCGPQPFGSSSGSETTREAVAGDSRPLLGVDFNIEPLDGIHQSGTLFELLGDEGTVVGVGFAEWYNTYRHNTSSDIQVFVRDANDQFEITDMGKPQGWLHTAFARTPSQLQLVNRPAGGSLARYDGGAWRLVSREANADEAMRDYGISQFDLMVDCGFALQRRANVGIFGNCLMADAQVTSLLGRPEISEADHKIRLRTLFAANGLYVAHKVNSEGRIDAFFYCRLSYPVELTNCHQASFPSPDEFFYALGVASQELVMATNRGSIYAVDLADMSLRKIRDDNGQSFQLYASARYGDQVLWGQYPSGGVLVFDEHGFHGYPSQLPIDSYRRSAAAELQSFAVYKGQLFAGVWPFGELFRLPEPGGSWSLVRRLFSGPAIEAFEPREPFTNQLGENLLGQRITDMTVLGDSLYITTGDKDGAIPDNVRKAVDPNLLDEYGKVHRVRSTGAFAANVGPLKPGKPRRFSLNVYEDRVELTENGVLIGEARIVVPLKGCVREVASQNGRFGTLIGVKSTATIATNRIPCKA
jgi:hypothetical protein